jgi:hypothetical protein
VSEREIRDSEGEFQKGRETETHGDRRASENAKERGKRTPESRLDVGRY